MQCKGRILQNNQGKQNIIRAQFVHLFATTHHPLAISLQQFKRKGLIAIILHISHQVLNIAKYASESKLNKSNGNMLIAMATRADFDPSKIRAYSIRQIERWVALANDLNAILEFDLLHASDGCQELTWNLTVNVEDLVADVRYNGYKYLSFELLERKFGPAISGVWWQINARELGSDNVLLALIVFEDASFATQTCEPLYGIFAVMISNMVAIHFISWI